MTGPSEETHGDIVSGVGVVGQGTTVRMRLREVSPAGTSGRMVPGSPVSSQDGRPIGVVTEVDDMRMSVDVMTSGVARFAVGNGSDGTVSNLNGGRVQAGDYMVSEGMIIGVALESQDPSEEFRRSTVKVSVLPGMMIPVPASPSSEITEDEPRIPYYSWRDGSVYRHDSDAITRTMENPGQ